MLTRLLHFGIALMFRESQARRVALLVAFVGRESSKFGKGALWPSICGALLTWMICPWMSFELADQGLAVESLTTGHGMTRGCLRVLGLLLLLLLFVTGGCLLVRFRLFLGRAAALSTGRVVPRLAGCDDGEERHGECLGG